VEYFAGLQDSELVVDNELQLNRLLVEDIEGFFIELYKHDGSRPSLSTINGYRSALRFMYTEKSVPLPEGCDERLKILFKGLKRSIVGEQQDGVRAIKTG